MKTSKPATKTVTVHAPIGIRVITLGTDAAYWIGYWRSLGYRVDE